MFIRGIVASAIKVKPDAPTTVVATNQGSGRAFNNGRASVSFSAPAFDGKSPITNYVVTSSPGGFTGSGAASPINVDGLQSNTAYTFTVTATNAIGTSAASSASASITATTVPQAPTIGTASAGDASASVPFTENATGGSAITSRTATSSPSSITGSGTSAITVSGLSNGTAYTFTVTVTNANGTSLPSAASNSVTPAPPFSFTPYAFTPFSFTPFSFTPFAFTPYAFTPYAFTPYAFTPYAFTPAYSFTPSAGACSPGGSGNCFGDFLTCGGCVS